MVDAAGPMPLALRRGRTVLLAVMGMAVFSCQQVLQRLNDEHGLGSAGTVFWVTVCCFLAALAIAGDMYVCRDPKAPNWYHRYKTTPGMLAAQTTVLSCFWVFNFDIVGLLFAWGCDTCKSVNSPSVRAYAYKFAFWSHVLTCIPIALLGPLQFSEKLRKFHGFLLHRWFGRILLLASVVHQASVSMLIIISLQTWKDWPDRLYYFALAVMNMYAWVAIIVGWPAGVRKNIPTHGAHMHRLGAMWFGIVVAFRVFRPFAGAVSKTWEDPIVAWAVAICCIGAVEVYLLKSGRFDADALLPQARCPLGQVG